MATVTDTAAHERWEKEIAAAPTREQPPTTVSSVPIEPLYTPESLNGFDPDTDLGYPGQYPYTRGVHASHVPQPVVDHASVRRLRHAAADQRALQVPARQGADRPQHRVRSADVDGTRQRRSARLRRGRPARRRRRTLDDMHELFAGIDLAEGVGVDDDQRAGHRHHGLFPRQRPRPGRGLEAAARHVAERHFEGVSRPERIRLSAGAARPSGLPM